MQATAAVINAGLGDISLGLEMAGIKVIAAYETDEKALAIHRTNINAPGYRLSCEEIDTNSFPEVDLLAARIYCPPFVRVMRAPDLMHDAFLHKLCEILSIHRPRALFLLLNASSVRNQRFQMYLDEIFKIGYQCIWQTIDVAQATGLPVKERTVCVIGTLRNTGESFKFSELSVPKQAKPDHYLQLNKPVDSWYFSVKPDEVLQDKDEKRFYCWGKYAYVGSDFVQWNYRKTPLVNIGGEFRKITHREIANLKGFPANYDLTGSTNRQWLYQKLMYANNVLVVKQIASIVNYILTDNPWRSRQVERGVQLENLVGRYLANLTDKGAVERNLRINGKVVDFVFHQGNQNLYFEVKYYNGRITPTSKIRAACEKLLLFKTDGMSILILANEVPDDVKNQCLEQFGVSIWDVGNLLWLFDKFSDIKNEFVAWLNYATEEINPKPPVPDVFQNVLEVKGEKLSWKEKLLRITPGREQFQEYETTCIDILKYVLGDYLTLWEVQESSNAGLYRFDLCCKIKNGVDQDFFDTIKHYFNTKYIVFEFKNYSNKISQKDIYTTEKYLYEKALRKVAIIISRQGADEHALQAARGSLRETGKLILCLSDNALLEMIDIKMRGEPEPAEFLDALLDDILVHLEK